jgi:membrane-associated phospholipid phosphatase
MTRPLDSTGRVLAHLALGAATVVGGGIAAGLLVGRVWPAEVLRLVDRPVTRALVGTRDPMLTDIMHAITALGGTAFVTAVVAVAAVASYYLTRRRRWPIFLLATILGAVALDNFVKYVINRPRPMLRPLVDPFGSSFPSGHTAAAAALSCALAFLLSRGRGRRAQAAIWATAAGVVILVAISRIYLGAHWLTDVVGGAALGSFWTAITARATEYAPEVPPGTTPPPGTMPPPRAAPVTPG